ncbi:hypothetical protein PJKIFABJ_00158 [Pseudomonas phage PE09]|uniref:Uncharacterized protein n=2 Tax=Otagovirus TaxID=2560197 RepID=A0A7S8BC55_9CAUD|nr:hypothetical protein QGX22_gp096 [Pseudomonas phage PE09]YP_010768445.1 hypothetical protein QGX23_gp094 [Pseudomonas phage PN09]QHZ60094.1 hypothetical protein PJKIFABJ_00158 [Pseudomonas phage PE09]QPB10558.1 hypothetical protein PN09_137 [Pseudomonas phage PN09]
MSMSHSEATAYIASMLEAIQVLHAQARVVSDEYDIPFDITLEGGRNYNTQAEYTPGWQSSSYNC